MANSTWQVKRGGGVGRRVMPLGGATRERWIALAGLRVRGRLLPQGGAMGSGRVTPLARQGRAAASARARIA